MKRLFLIILFLYSWEISFSQNYNRRDSIYICWEYSKKLSWNDFKMRKDTLLVSEQYTLAYASVKLVLKDNKISALFVPCKSFFDKILWSQAISVTNSTEDIFLKHEQLHFDITELYARKFRYKVSKLKKNIFDGIDNTFDSISEEHSGMQEKYDYEVYEELGEFSLSRQKEWINKVKKELDRYKKYESTKNDCFYQASPNMN
jgi:hypothetical protein